MITVYLDESGDLGFDFDKPGTSRFFVVTALICDNTRPVANAVRKIFKGFSKAQIRRHGGVLHATSESPETRRRLLTLLASLDISVVAVRLDKYRVDPGLPTDKHALYNHLVKSLLDRATLAGLLDSGSVVTIVASRRETSARLNRSFTNHVQGSPGKPDPVRLMVQVSSPSDKGLQAVDLVSWSLFRKYEGKDSSYADLVSDIVMEESRA